MEKEFRIKDIFVGRKDELEKLQYFWRLSQDVHENEVYAVLNAPGVGKTILLEYFGNQIMKEKKGLMVEIKSSDDNNTVFKYLSHTLKELQKSITENRKRIIEYVKIRIEKENELEDDKDTDRKCYFYSTKEDAIESLESIEKAIKILTKRYEDIELRIYPDADNPQNLSSSFPGLIRKLSNIIPVFLFIDEIQELESLSFINMKKVEETLLHLCSSELASLLKSKVLITVSGTQYRLMKEIGYGIGSPLRDKVDHFVIHPLKREELKEYYIQIAEYFSTQINKKKLNSQLTIILPYYKQLIYGYSGGHARTVARLTKEFLKFDNNKNIPKTYEKFLDKYTNLSDAERYYPDFTSRIKDGIEILQNNHDFKKIVIWIQNLSIFDQNLGKRPEVLKLNKNTEYITNELVQMGVLMINGNQNYYITSYFHLLAFLNAIQDEYSIFLNEILTNKYFKLMCGYHSGLGFVFEEIFLATIMRLPDLKTPEIVKKIPFDLTINYDVIQLAKSVNYSTLELVNNAIYHTPLGTGVDFIIVNEKKIVLLQVTTIQSVDLKKMQSMDEIYNTLTIKYQNHDMLKWFISLFPIKDIILNKISKTNLLISADENLKEIVGKEMFDRIKAVKDEFRNPYN